VEDLPAPGQAIGIPIQATATAPPAVAAKPEPAPAVKDSTPPVVQAKKAGPAKRPDQSRDKQ